MRRAALALAAITVSANAIAASAPIPYFKNWDATNGLFYFNNLIQSINVLISTLLLTISLHVATLTAAKALTDLTTNTAVFRDAYATPGDGGQAQYTYSKSACSLNSGAGDNGSQIDVTAGGCLNIARLSHEMSVMVWGADPTGASDSTAAINAALTAQGTGGGCVYVPSGTYKVTDVLTLPASYYCLYGDGRTASVLVANSASFNLSALGVVAFQSNSGGDGGVVRDLGIEFVQPTPANRAAMVAFPPGIYMPGATSRFQIDNIQIGGGPTCIDAGHTGSVRNIAGSFRGVWCGSLSYGLRMDGAADGVEISDWHEWNFNITSGNGLLAIYQDGNNECMDIGRVDGLTAVNMQCFYANLVWTADAANSEDSNMITNLTMDNSMVIQNASASTGNFITNIENSGSSASVTTLQAVVVKGGHLNITGFRFGMNSTSVDSSIEVDSGGNLNLASGSLGTNPTGVQAAVVNSGGFLKITNTVFGGVAGMTAPVVEQVGGSLQVITSRFSGGPSGGTGVGISFDVDSAQNLYSMTPLLGWSVSIPGSHSLGTYDIGVTCAGSPTSSFATSPDGTVTHC